MNQTEIAHAYEVEFGERTMPKDAYRTLMESAIRADWPLSILDMNGYNISRSFAPYFNSTSSMESACAMCFADLYANDVPRIRFMADQIGMPPPIISAAMRDRITSGMIQNVEWAIESEYDRMRYSAPSTFTEKVNFRGGVSMDVRLSEFIDDNLSQHNRKMQASFESKAEHYIRLAADALDAFCKAFNATWEIRPLYAMPGNDYRTIHSLSTTAGLRNPTTYMSLSNIKAHERLVNLRLFPDLDPIESLYNYHTWFNSCNFGRITFDGTSTILGVGPVGLPPQLLEPTRTSIPFYISDLIPGHLARDQIAVYYKFRESQLTETPGYAEVGQFVLAGRVLQILMACASILLAGQNWGRGNRKPSWIMSPCNYALINHINIIAAYECEKLQEMCK